MNLIHLNQGEEQTPRILVVYLNIWFPWMLRIFCRLERLLAPEGRPCYRESVL